MFKQCNTCYIKIKETNLICEDYTKNPPQGPTTVGTGSGTPEVPSARGYSWATLSPGVINTETWSCMLGVGRGANNPTP
jgi:hypothetical protein